MSNEDIYNKLCSLENALERMRGEMHELAVENEKLRGELKVCRAETETAKQAARNAEKVTLTTRAKLVELEQYGRMNNVRVFGLKESEGEMAKECEEKFISLVKNKLKIDIRTEDLEAVHRVGRSGGDRAIIARFISRKNTARVLRGRRVLKGSGVSIAEDLTWERLALLKQVKERGHEAWTSAWGR